MVVINQSNNNGKKRIQQVATAKIYSGMIVKKEVLNPPIHSMECTGGNRLEIFLNIVFCDGLYLKYGINQSKMSSIGKK